MEESSKSVDLRIKIAQGDFGYVLQDVPHLSDYIPNLPIVVHKDTPRGIHLRRAGPREMVYFDPDEVHACIVTCGGLCVGLNTVIREIVCGLYNKYGVSKVIGIDGGYKGFYANNTKTLDPKVVNNIHKRGGTILGTSQGGHDTTKIVDSIEDRGINQHCLDFNEGSNQVAITDRMWARLLSSTNQPSFLGAEEIARAKKEESEAAQSADGENCKNNST